jgi:hypothetical protein
MTEENAGVGDRNSIRDSRCGFLRSPALKLMGGADLFRPEWMLGAGGIEAARAKTASNCWSRQALATPSRTRQPQMQGFTHGKGAPDRRSAADAWRQVAQRPAGEGAGLVFIHGDKQAAYFQKY